MDNHARFVLTVARGERDPMTRSLCLTLWLYQVVMLALGAGAVIALALALFGRSA